MFGMQLCVIASSQKQDWRVDLSPLGLGEEWCLEAEARAQIVHMRGKCISWYSACCFSSYDIKPRPPRHTMTHTNLSFPFPPRERFIDCKWSFFFSLKGDRIRKTRKIRESRSIGSQHPPRAQQGRSSGNRVFDEQALVVLGWFWSSAINSSPSSTICPCPSARSLITSFQYTVTCAKKANYHRPQNTDPTKACQNTKCFHTFQHQLQFYLSKSTTSGLQGRVEHTDSKSPPQNTN